MHTEEKPIRKNISQILSCSVTDINRNTQRHRPQVSQSFSQVPMVTTSIHDHLLLLPNSGIKSLIQTALKVKVAQSCPTLCNPMDYTAHGILQARILEWVAVPFFRGSSQPRDWTQVSLIAGRFFTSWATREAQEIEIHMCRNYPININNSRQRSRHWISSTSSPKAIHIHLFNCQTLLQPLIPREGCHDLAQSHFHGFYPRCLSSLRPKPPNWENQFLGMLTRSPASPRIREGTGALMEEIGVWSSQGGEKDKHFVL